jgi:hypothetical protein
MSLLDCVAVFAALLISHFGHISLEVTLLFAVAFMGIIRLLGYAWWPAKPVP